MINTEKATDVVEKWLKHQSEEVIKKLSKNPKLRFQYIQRVLNSKSDEIESIFPYF